MPEKCSLIARLLVVSSLVLGACSQMTALPKPAQPQATEIIQTVEVPGQPAVVVATPMPASTKEFKSKDPTTFVGLIFYEPDSLDPALDYETTGGGVLQNIYESLVFYNREKPGEFIPMLATEVPTQDNGGISADGKTYIFKIRPGVKFHTGDPLTPSDVAYSFQRGILQGGTNSPQWLLTEPFFGGGIDDISLLVDPKGSLQDDQAKLKAADPARLKTACQKVQQAIQADDVTGTVTMHLAQPWGPFIPTLAQTWGSVMDKKWVAENGGWDGSCDTWQNTYAIKVEEDPFHEKTNGTGPFKLDHWITGEEILLARNEDYWRTAPLYPGAPTGPARLQTVLLKNVADQSLQNEILQAGDADWASVLPDDYAPLEPLVGEQCQYNNERQAFYPCASTSHPDAPLRVWKGSPSISRSALFFNQKINTQDGNNHYIGSGQLDGEGIPPDFFSDLHVRKAFSYCLDMDTFIKDVLTGEAVPAAGIPLPGMPGWDPNGPKYSFDLGKCAEEFKAANLKSPDGKSLWETGFSFRWTFPAKISPIQTYAEILASNLSAVNPKFHIELQGVPFPVYLSDQQAGILPVFNASWQEDIHDPHNWYAPFLTGSFGRNMNLPDDLTRQLQDLVNQGVAEKVPSRRAEIYNRLNQLVYDQVLLIMGPVQSERNYTQRWVQGFYRNPIEGFLYFYDLWKD